MLDINFSAFPDLETPRLLLRNISVTDAPELFFLRSHPSTMQYLDREPHKSVEETALFIEDKMLGGFNKNESITWAITFKTNPEKMIGTIGFWRIDKDHYRAEIGYMLHPDHWQKGITKEATLACIHWAFSATEIHSIEANINPHNDASAALLKSTGFVQEAYFKENYFFNGVFKDTIIYSLVKGIHYK